MVKEQWWSLLKVLVQRYQTGAGPAISAILSAALPEGSVLARAIGSLAQAHVELKGQEQVQRVEVLLQELGEDKQYLSKVVGLLVARFDILIRELSEIQKMGVKGEALKSVAQQKVAETQNDIIKMAVADLQTSVGPKLVSFDEVAQREEEPTAFSSAPSMSQPAAQPKPEPAAHQGSPTQDDGDLMHGPKSPEVGRAPQEPAESPKEPQAGDVIGGQDWHLLSLLGKGGMGSVWKARNHFEELGALKLMLPHLVSNERLIKRFQLEIRAIKKIRHNNVVALSDWGKDRFHGKEQWYFVTDFIEGKPLSRILQEDGAMSMEKARDLFIPLAEGLHAAHAEGVVHRDIKPGNIMVRPDGSPVIIDFGIARQLADPSMTQAHERVLTLQFASPEQLYGEPVSPKSDVFSLAATLSFVLFPDPKRQRPQFEPDKMPEPYHWILETCLSYKPENRPEDMLAFVELLKQLEFKDGNIVSYPKRPVKTGQSSASVGSSPDQAFTPGGSAPASAEPAGLSKEIYHYNGPSGQDKLPLDEIFEKVKADPRGRHLLWRKGWPNWQMWHKVSELKEYVQALKEGQAQQPPQASAPLNVSPFSKHTLNIGGCQHTMIALPPGSFWMGNQNIDAESDEKPRHRVNLSKGFLLGQTQLTQDLYEVIEGFNPSQFKFPNHPAERVSWSDVVKWCNKLSENQGLSPAYNIKEMNGKLQVSWNMQSDGYRLPTEAEWEYAARAASNFNYAGSNRPDEVAWFGASRRREGQRTYRVGQKQPNGWDFYDMSGNVWEWCWEDARGYQAGEITDPVGTTGTTSRVCRGGSNYLDARQTRCSYRMRYDINYRSVFVGFRIARSLT